MYRFQETGLWSQSPPSHFAPASPAPGAPPVFSLSLPTGTHIVHQLQSLAGASTSPMKLYTLKTPNPQTLTPFCRPPPSFPNVRSLRCSKEKCNIFFMHGHVAILPPLVCGGEGVWCLTDAMLVHALHEAYVLTI
jgi:hypothetical protein